MSSHGGQPFPLSKLAFMYVKKIAQPIARRIADKARSDERFKNYVCLPPANLYHFYEAKIKFKFMNLGKIRITKVPKLSEKAAIELGSNLAAEMLIMSVASAIALNEVRKYKQREKETDEELENESLGLLNHLEALNRLVDIQKKDIDRLSSIIEMYEEELRKSNDERPDS